MKGLIMVYTLITVTYGGEVNHSRGYETLHMCQQAKSLALTGMTIEQNKAADVEYEQRVAKNEAEWRAAHPPRKPVTEDDFRMVEHAKDGCGMLASTGPFERANPDDGLIYLRPASPSHHMSSGCGSVEYSRGGWRRLGKHHIKVAECVIEPPTDTSPASGA